MTSLLSKIKAIATRKKYTIYTEPYRLNIFGLRGKSTVPNKFDDEIHVFYYDEKKECKYFLFKATTDPGTFWLNNPSSKKGTAILVEGQYKDAYSIGLHKGKDKALVQIKPVTVIRDNSKNGKLNFKSQIKEKGNFGINIHHAKKSGKTYTIDKYSAGCQVFQDAESFNLFLKMCDKHKSLYGNKFTYTLLDFRTVKSETLRRLAITAGFISSLVIGYFIRKKLKRK